MSHLPEHLAHFRTLGSLRPPRVTVAIAWILTVGVAVAIFILFFVPWLQTAQGRGQVVSLDPQDLSLIHI